MALEDGFLRRILRGPETGSGSDGGEQAEDPEMKRRQQVAAQIDTILADESVQGDTRIAFEQFKSALGNSTVAEANQMARGLLISTEDQEVYDALVSEYRIRNGHAPLPAASGEASPAQEAPAAVEVPAAPTLDAAAPARDAGGEAAAVSEEASQPINDMSEAAALRQSTNAQPYVDDIEERFTQKGRNNARKELKRVKGKIPEGLYNEVVLQLERRNVKFEKLPGENGGAESRAESVERPASRARAEIAAEPVAAPEAPIPAHGIESDMTELEQELARALRQETPEDRRERLTGVIRNYRLLMSNNEVRANEYLSDELARFSDDEAHELREIMRGSEGALTLALEVPTEVAGAEIASTDSEVAEVLHYKNTEDLKKALGRYENTVNGIPYWDLADGDAVLPGPRDSGAVRVGKNGMIAVKGQWFRYTGDAFEPMTPEQVQERRQEVAEILRGQWEGKTRPGTPEASEAPEARAPEAPAMRATPDAPREAPVLSAEQAYQQFIQMRARSRQPAIATAFQESARNLRPEDRRPLWDRLVREEYISPNTAEGIKDGILNRLAYEDQLAGRTWETTAAVTRNPAESPGAASTEGFTTTDEALAEFESRIGRKQRLSTAYREATKRTSLFTLDRVISRLRKNREVDQAELERVIGRDSRLSIAPVAPAEASRAVEAPAPERVARTEEGREARERRELSARIQREADAIFGPDRK